MKIQSEILSKIESLPAYKQLKASIEKKEPLPSLSMSRASRLAALSSLYNGIQVPFFYLTDRSERVPTLLAEMTFWLPDARIYTFPDPTPLFYEMSPWNNTIRRERLQVLTLLAGYHLPVKITPQIPPIIITSPRALMTRTMPRRDFLKSCRELRQGQTISPNEVIRNWVDIGYESEEMVLEPGQFSHRGGIMDIWPPMEDRPVRIELFGNEIDSLRAFEPASQRTLQKVEKILITPAREYLPGKAEGLEIEPSALCEFHLPLIHPAVASLLDYLPREAVTYIDDLDLFRSVVTDIEEEAVRLREESIADHDLSEQFPIPYLSWSEIQDSLSGHYTIDLGRSSAEGPCELAQAFQPGPRFGGQLKNTMDHLSRELDGTKNRAVIISRQAPRLTELWREYHPGETEPGNPPVFVENSLTEGWILRIAPDEAWELYTDGEIFGYERPQPRQRHIPSAEAPEAAYADLKPGDWVVHVDYGIGRFTGLVQRSLEGIEREFLCVEYLGGDQLFVPVHQADRLTRYIGSDGDSPSMARLGGTEWAQTKGKVTAAVQEIASDLLDLYTKRQLAVGYAFHPDNQWQQELEASFPYMETEDQAKAIRAVKHDMEAAKPMDRLLCGDVGYGKTEVALRAAFKAVLDGKQVAVLVPTTVLAQQHYETFRQRLSPFPANVEMLSRFRNPKEQDEIIKKLDTGAVDIIIGTHRLLSSDVVFKDLGLVIIDEEQRFGVTHKEYLKKLRTEVDVLTLTATPIPRTLYMALTGVRDISTINTPPEERLPVLTHIGPYSPRLVRQAVMREIERGGQAFFVHNRVQSIPAMYAHLSQLVPDAKIGIAHGQMNEHELSGVMQKFTHGDIDVLLCTSIIESGLDIPNANTLIVDRADTFGLAQLYQLRGRVGRGAQRAYGYFFRHRRKAPTVEGEERLEVLADNTQLGAGYSIAMRDLEMRGAGELLGTHQHGYIASVGFHLYTRLLAQSVKSQRVKRGLPLDENNDSLLNKEIRLPVTVELPISAGIPVTYIPDQNTRLRLYRRIADLDSETDLDAITEEFNDRFGPIPPMVTDLIFQMKIKLRAEKAGLAAVGVENDQLVLRYPPLPEGVTSRSLPVLGLNERAGKNAYWLAVDLKDSAWRDQLLNVLQEILHEMRWNSAVD
jgi:transcription-repair coupling factor (superfamily II helicase)